MNERPAGDPPGVSIELFAFGSRDGVLVPVGVRREDRRFGIAVDTDNVGASPGFYRGDGRSREEENGEDQKQTMKI